MAAMNDWLVAGINNPDMTVSDMADFAGMTVDNTQFLSADEYKKYDFVQNNDMFKNEQGQFDENLFNSYYSMRADEFNTFVSNDFYRGPALDVFDIDRTADTPVADNGFNITRGFNPNRQQIGIEGVNVWSAPTFSQRELAKQNKIFNTETGEFEDYSVDDHTLVKNPVEWFKDLWKDPLVLATWDEDGTHIDPTTGIVQQHVKGEAKLNDKGTYYYETLGDRSVLGKDVLSMFDTLTVDGEGLNKYDFFDSNDLKKSVGGTIMKSVMNALPMFIPYVGTVYSAVTMGRELAKTLPMLTGMVTSLTGGDTPEWAEKAAAWGKRASFSMSDKAMQNTFNFEHFANLVSDLALLTGQQKLIAQTLGGLRGGAKYIEEAQAKANALFQAELPKYANRLGAVSVEDIQKACLNKFLPQAQKLAQKSGQLGRDAGLAYIALTMQSGTYDEMLEKGATKKEASAVALGATLGMFSVDKWLHLGELFYNDYTGDTTKFIKKLMKDKVGEMSKVYKDAVRLADDEKKGLLSAIRRAKDNVATWMQDYSSDLKYHTTTATGKIIGGGVERISEEACSDLAKGLYALAGLFGYDTSVKPEDVGVFENAGDRYMMTFLGGALGAGLFYGKEIADRRTFKAPKIEQNFETLIRNGYADEMRAEVDRLEKEGKTGSKKLMSIPDDVEIKDGKVLFRTTEDQTISQSKFIADKVRDEINIVDEAINSNEHSAMNDDDVFENLIMGEARLRRYQEMAGMTGYFQENGNRIHSYVEAYRNLKKAQNSIDGKPESEPVNNPSQPRTSDYAANLTEAQKAFDNAKSRMEELHNGDYCLDYTRMLCFALDPEVHEAFMKLDRESYCKSLYNDRGLEDLTIDELVNFLPKWEEYKKNEIGTILPKAYELYKLHGEDANPAITKKVEDADAYLAFDKNMGDILAGKVQNDFVLGNFIADYDTKFEFESDEAYENRNKKMTNPLTGEEESDADFVIRVKNRQRLIDEWNTNQEKKFIEIIREQLRNVEYKIDTATYRRIKSYIGEYGRPREIINRALERSGANEIAKEAFRLLRPDLGNVDDVINNMVEISVSKAENTLAARKENALNDFESRMTSLKNLKVNYTGKNADGKEVEKTTSLETYFTKNHTMTRGDTLGDYLRKSNEFETGVDGAKDPLEGMFEGSRVRFNSALQKIRDYGLMNDTELERLDFFDLVGGQLVNDRVRNFVDADGKNIGEAIIDRYIKNRTEVVYDPEYGAINADEYVDYVRQHTEQKGIEISEMISRDPVIEFMSDLRKELRNPAEDIVDAIAEKRGETLPKGISKILEAVWSDYDSLEDLNSFYIDDTDIDNINNLIDIIEEAKVYITAASTVPDVDNPFGHNKSINEFAEKNSGKLTKAWKKLPELRSDLAMLYTRQLNYAERELKNWIKFSEEIQLDKSKKIIATDTAINSTHSKILLDCKDRFVTLSNGEKYKIFDGIEKIDLTGMSGARSLKVLYDIESLLFRNIDAIAASEGLSIVELVKTSDLLDMLVPGLKEINNQSTSKINDQLTIETYNTFSRLMYIASVLSERPADYYKRMRETLNDDTELVPIGAQDLMSRGVQALLTNNFHQIISYAYETYISMKDLPLLERFVMMQGSAGVGKTRTGFVPINKILKDKVVWLVAPSDRAVEKLTGDLKRDSKYGYKIDDLLKKILGEETFNDIYSTFDEEPDETAAEYDGVGKLIDKNGEPIKYYTIRTINEANVAEIVPDNIKFADIPKEELPAAILIDEATNINTVWGQIINKFAREKGIFVPSAGDFTQWTPETKNGVFSLEPNVVFMARMPELTLTMRSNNLQNQQNQYKFKALIDQMNAIALDPRVNESGFLEDAYVKYKDLFSKIGLAAYINDDINGHYITNNLDEGLLGKLKTLSEEKDVAFVGSSSSSALESLRSAGVKVKDVLDPNDMKGSEYDYVVVDYDFTKHNAQRFGSLWGAAQVFYTLMTRATEGTVFLDNGVSDLFGSTRVTNNKSKAPDIRNSIQALREAKLKALDELDYSEAGRPLKSAGTGSAEENAEVETEENGSEGETEIKAEGESAVEDETSKDDEAEHKETKPKKKRSVKGKKVIGGSEGKNGADNDGKLVSVEKSLALDPEERDSSSPENEEMNRVLQTVLELDSQFADADPVARDLGIEEPTENAADQGSAEAQNQTIDYAAVGLRKNKSSIEMDHESYGFSVLSVNDGGEIQGEPDTVRAWKIVMPKKSEPARNLQAVYGRNALINKFDEKREAERKLAVVRSAAKYNKLYSDMPDWFKERFSKEAWNARRICLEFRFVDEKGSDSQRPLFSPFKYSGMAPNGAKKQFYANYVLVLESKGEGGADFGGQKCVFDISGLNDPETLKKNLPEIKKSLSNAKEKVDPQTAERLDRTIKNVDNVSDAYGKWMTERYNELENTGKPLVYDVNDVLVMSRRVWRKKSNPIRLDGMIDPSHPLNEEKVVQRNLNNFKVKYGSCFKFSDVYVVTSEMCERFNLEPSLKGRALFFYTDDMLLDNMEDFYIVERQNYINKVQNGKEADTPDMRVRIAMLDNYGVSWSDLCNDEYFATLSDVYRAAEGEEAVNDQKKIKKPLNMNFTGVRMFSSLWNARAALSNFNEKYKAWCEENKFSDEQVNALLNAQYEVYRMREEGNHSTDNIMSKAKEILKESNAFNLSDVDKSGGHTVESLLESIDNFNNIDLIETPMFRLGHYVGKKGLQLGFHIQSYEVSDSELYKGKTFTINGRNGNWINLCAITPAAAKRIESVLDAVLEPISGARKDGTLPLIWFGKKSVRPGGQEETVLLGKKEYIDVGDGSGEETKGGEKNYKSTSGTRALTGVSNSFVGRRLYLDGFEYGGEELWSMIPRYLVKFCKQGYAVYRNGLGDNTSRKFSFYTVDSESKEQINSSFSINYKPLLSSEEGGNMFDIFNLIFHGTTDNIHRVTTKDNYRMQMSDAYYKYGFYINPGAERSSSQKTIYLKDENGGKDLKAILIPCNTPGIVFNVNFMPMESSIRILNSEVMSLGRSVRSISYDEVVKNGRKFHLDFKRKLYSSEESNELDRLEGLEKGTVGNALPGVSDEVREILLDMPEEDRRMTVPDYNKKLKKNFWKNVINATKIDDPKERRKAFIKALKMQYVVSSDKAGEHFDNQSSATESDGIRTYKEMLDRMFMPKEKSVDRTAHNTNGRRLMLENVDGQWQILYLEGVESDSLGSNVGADERVVASFVVPENADEGLKSNIFGADMGEVNDKSYAYYRYADDGNTSGGKFIRKSEADEMIANRSLKSSNGTEQKSAGKGVDITTEKEGGMFGDENFLENGEEKQSLRSAFKELKDSTIYIENITNNIKYTEEEVNAFNKSVDAILNSKDDDELQINRNKFLDIENVKNSEIASILLNMDKDFYNKLTGFNC